MAEKFIVVLSVDSRWAPGDVVEAEVRNVLESTGGACLPFSPELEEEHPIGAVHIRHYGFTNKVPDKPGTCAKLVLFVPGDTTRIVHWVARIAPASLAPISGVLRAMPYTSGRLTNAPTVHVINESIAIDASNQVRGSFHVPQGSCAGYLGIQIYGYASATLYLTTAGASIV